MSGGGWGIAETWREATALAAEFYAVKVEVVRESGQRAAALAQVTGWRRGRHWNTHGPAVAARKLAVYLTVATAEASQRQIARALGVGKSALCSHENEIARRIDEDDPFDDCVTELLELLSARLALAARQAEAAERWRACA